MQIVWINASELESDDEKANPCSSSSLSSSSVVSEANDDAWTLLRECNGVVVPGGFGERGAEGMIVAARYCRLNKVPYLGVCLGMQVMVIEFARSKLGITGATSEEFSNATSTDAVAGEKEKEKEKNVVLFMPEGSKDHLGGTMRLGARTTIVQQGSLAASVYGVTKSCTTVMERHRHRYEVDPDRVVSLEKAGLVFSGRDTTGLRMEICELPSVDHPFYFGTQFHPEFKSRPHRPSPPFYCLVAAALGQQDQPSFTAAGEMWQEQTKGQGQSGSLVNVSSPLRYMAQPNAAKRSSSVTSQTGDGSPYRENVKYGAHFPTLPTVASIDGTAKKKSKTN